VFKVITCQEIYARETSLYNIFNLIKNREYICIYVAFKINADILLSTFVERAPLDLTYILVSQQVLLNLTDQTLMPHTMKI